MGQYHLAQLNIANAVASMESPEMEGFVARLDEIHELSDNAVGFIWRWESGSVDSSVVDVFGDREAWFDKMPEMHQAIWWVPAGHIPSVAEAKQRLDSLRAEGPTVAAFTMARPFPMPAN